MTFFFPTIYSLLLLLPLCFSSFTMGATLQEDEVKALKDIGKTLGKKDWDFSVDPCSGGNNWISKSEENAVTCNCSYQNNTLCHVVSVVLKAQNLSGTLPPDLVRLPFVQEIDLTLNYLNGTIPKQWATLNLVNISFYGNRLSGPIPKEFGKITTLKSLVLEFNQLSGNLPPELGSLSQIERLLLSSNNFTGVLPATFANLTALKQFVIRGSGLSGPIPAGISLLKNLTDLTITDLNGSDSPFPHLENMSRLSKLELRSCNIAGALPDYLGKLINLKVIELSNNKLSGQIPMSFHDLKNMYLLFLSGNHLSGPLPDWIDKPDFVDLSYNNFTITKFEQQTCQQGSVNLFASSLKGNSLGNISCLENYNCPKTWYSLYINCGGKSITFDGNKTYDDDSSEMEPARYRQFGTNWALITSGHFFDSGRPDYYKWSNTTKLAVDNDAELYMDARVSPNSLTYYGFCLGNGNYTVNLHFAEIMFSDDKTFSSIGRRVFDIYIQRKLVVKDFDIVKEAGGVGKEVIKIFTASVTRNALEIRLYWAGKGTTTIPFGSVYGPLISAISVDPDFIPPSENSRSISAGVVAAIVAAGAIVFILIIGILWWKGCLRLKCLGTREKKASQSGLFTLRQIKSATNNFDESFKIGEGGFGPVYKGVLSDGTIVAIKQLSSKSKQGSREFINEIGMISTLQHPNLVKLYGFCMEDDQLLLIYEYMENNSLAHALFAKKEDLENRQLRLDWKTRKRICIGIAKGLAYLHGESKIKIIHRDIKATNVLLDKDLNPKISDFGLAKLNEDDKTHMNTRIAGTYGYMAPEYAMHGYLTDKADVYSFGIVMLEIVSGTNNTVSQEECFSLLDWVHLLEEKDDLMELIDRRLGEDFKKEEVRMMINVALLCTNFSPSLRPSMSSVVSMLEGRTNVQEVVAESTEVLDDKKYKVMQQYYKQIGENSTSEAQSIQTDDSRAFIYDDTDSSIREHRN
ncbi:unnamed protein product [Trifolium pratense]|uniref:Uncharacterized protein n=2 Tax=Trifolium pratense TaxID=57577 RepID=A0ACB0KI36_TRIPR|nr:unnamed protein product [Trifolium pratense]